MPATKKLVTLSSDEIAAKLDNEPNMSAVVEAVLARHYGIALEGEGVHIDQRREVLESLGDYPLVHQEPLEPQLVTEPTPGPMLTEEDPEEVASAEFIAAHEEPSVGFEPVEQVLEEQQVSVENPVETGDNPSLVEQLQEVTAPEEVLPVYEEAAETEVLVEAVEEPVAEEPVEAVVEEPAVEEAPEPPINYLGQAGNVCDIHGPYIGSICIDCL